MSMQVVQHLGVLLNSAVLFSRIPKTRSHVCLSEFVSLHTVGDTWQVVIVLAVRKGCCHSLAETALTGRKRPKSQRNFRDAARSAPCTWGIGVLGVDPSCQVSRAPQRRSRVVVLLRSGSWKATRGARRRGGFWDPQVGKLVAWHIRLRAVVRTVTKESAPCVLCRWHWER